MGLEANVRRVTDTKIPQGWAKLITDMSTPVRLKITVIAQRDTVLVTMVRPQLRQGIGCYAGVDWMEVGMQA